MKVEYRVHFKKSLFDGNQTKTTKQHKSNKLYINKIEFVIIRLIRVILFFKGDSNFKFRK